MNKKFSTFLCASLLLASAFTTANAADLTGVNNGMVRMLLWYQNWIKLR